MLAGTAFAAQAQSTDVAPTHWRFGVQLGAVHDNGRTDPIFQLSFGYAFDPTWSVEALIAGNLDFVREGTDPTQPYEFDSAWGARVRAALPLSEHWTLDGGLGVATVHEERGLTIHGYGRDRTGALVSGDLMYRLGRRWSLGLEVSSFTQSHTLNTGLRSEFHF
ncbi:outer membrane beta-barrel protein [Scleromatobacter humisilvae]|uniref:Outer membrane protein beta-barrel domain-containing protein n=1 Tax=Scleromatobacter humisilvae TaxID=2897159 RepID=A0A9X1YKW1_9BURK|nr:outer membrane beta-barrel protein [Scleromatobacter humisilvae]MCK9686770.1 hypothetical protein [Scleromatobacter humisilvae]